MTIFLRNRKFVFNFAMQTESVGIISRFILMDTPMPIDFKILINLTFWGRAICEDARPRLFIVVLKI